MTPTPRLTLVEEALEADPPPPAQVAGVKAALKRWGPSIAKAARREERQAIFQAAGAKTIDDLAAFPKLMDELDARWEREEAKHGHAMYWRGAMHWSVVNLIMGAALACIAIFAMQGVIWTTATRAFREQAMTGAMLSAQDERPAPQYGQQP